MRLEIKNEIEAIYLIFTVTTLNTLDLTTAKAALKPQKRH